MSALQAPHAKLQDQFCIPAQKDYLGQLSSVTFESLPEALKKSAREMEQQGRITIEKPGH